LSGRDNAKRGQQASARASGTDSKGNEEHEDTWADILATVFLASATAYGFWMVYQALTEG
jgi:hypothetical protein